ncbi:MAG: argininosuccinate lyase [Fimbriimonadaceae bacterium]|nr:argininosuccinate lyase [Fimbriimonadaceae bacterium]
MRKLWGGAFGADGDALVERFGQSLDSDLRFWKQDVLGSIAHARMLGAEGMLTREESDRLVAGLEEILAEGSSSLPRDVEDIHTAVELRLAELVGDVAGKLHTARSRNDQVATDTRLYLRSRLPELQSFIKELQRVLLATSRDQRRTVMPGYTHQQRAQPYTLGFHLMAHFWALQRHGWRLANVDAVTAFSPLGSAALAGTGFPIDRFATAQELGFVEPIPNALDATSDRSFVLDALHALAALMIDLSRISQELVLWSGVEFGFVTLSDSMTTGSSIMPQKRNPDMAELIRGRTGRAIANWVALATTLKALPLGYNRDTQDDKPPLFESLDLTEDALRLTGLMLKGATWHADRMRQAMKRDFSTATDLADLLASRGMPFRKAHEVVGKVTRACRERGIGLEDLTAEDLAKLAPEAPPESLAALKPERSALARNSYGGPGLKAMQAQFRRADKRLKVPGFSSPY